MPIPTQLVAVARRHPSVHRACGRGCGRDAARSSDPNTDFTDFSTQLALPPAGLDVKEVILGLYFITPTICLMPLLDFVVYILPSRYHGYPPIINY